MIDESTNEALNVSRGMEQKLCVTAFLYVFEMVEKWLSPKKLDAARQENCFFWVNMEFWPGDGRW